MAGRDLREEYPRRQAGRMTNRRPHAFLAHGTRWMLAVGAALVVALVVAAMVAKG